MRTTIIQLTLSVTAILCAWLGALAVIIDGDTGWWYVLMAAGLAALYLRSIVKRQKGG